MSHTVMPKKSFPIHQRWALAFLGFALLITGQLILASEDLANSPATKLGTWLTQTIHLSIPSIENVLKGVPFLIIGAILMFVSLNPIRILPSQIPFSEKTFIWMKDFRATAPWILAGVACFGILLWQLNKQDYHDGMILLWLTAILVFGIAAAILDHCRQVSNSPGLARVDLLWMAGLFLITLVTGTFRLQGLPDMLMGDEGSFWTAARDIANGTFQPSIFGSGVYTFPVLSSIGQAWILKLFGANLWGWRFGSVLAGAMTVFPLYLLGRDLFNRRVAIASVLALAFSPYFLAFSRLGYNNIQSLFITALAIYWIYIGTQRSSLLYLFLAGCAAGMGFYTYFAARMTIVIILLFIFFLLLGRKIRFKQAAISLAAILVGAFLVITPYILYGIQHDSGGLSFKIFESVFFNTFNGLQFYSMEELTAIRPIFKVGGNELFYNPEIYFTLILRGLIRTILIFQKPWLISEHFIAFPLTGTIGVFFYLIGLGAFIKRLKEPRSFLILTWFLVVIFGLSILNTVPPRHTHMVNIIPMLALATGIGINIVTGALAASLAVLKKGQTIIFSALLVVLSVGGINDYFIKMPERYHPQPDQIISWAGLYAEDEKFIYIYANVNELDRARPYLLSEFHSEASFQSIALEQFLEDPELTTSVSKAILFYMPDQSDVIEPVLAQKWGQGIFKKDFYSPDGIPVLSAGMNTPFVFERDRNFWSILGESYGRPSLGFLFLGIAILMGVIAFFPTRWVNRFPEKFKRLIAWFNSPVLKPTLEEATPPLEFEIPLERQPEVKPEPPPWQEEVLPASAVPPREKVNIRIHTEKTDIGRRINLQVFLPSFRPFWEGIPSGWKITLSEFHPPAPFLLSSSVIIAIFAQVSIFMGKNLLGAGLYCISALGFIFWHRQYPKWTQALIGHVRIPPKAEIILFLLILLAAIFIRFYDLDQRVYGLEADETKWTVQSWYSTILRVDKGEFAGMHYQFLPVDFWVRSLYLRIFGLNFLSARIESAVNSILAIIFLYLLVRRLTTSPPTALLASMVYAFSFIALNASHQALHNTSLEPWMMAGLFFLVTSLHDGKLWKFQTAGILLALGMLTYETFYPTVLVAILYATASLAIQISKKQSNFRQLLTKLLVLTWPIVIVYFAFTRHYLQARHGYHFGWLERVSENRSEIAGFLAFIGKNIGELLETTFSRVTWPDALLRWQGSFLSEIILPFVLLGLVFSLCNLRRPGNLFVLTWYLVNVAIAPIGLGSVWPRVLYTTLAPLTIWAGMGLLVFFGMLRTWLGQARIKWAVIIFSFVIVAFLISDYGIFTRGINDPIDRVKRRELADITFQSSQNTSLIILPYMPTLNDSVELESHVILFSVAGARKTGLEAENYFKQVPFDNLLLAMWENRDTPSLDIIFDKGVLAQQATRFQIINTILQCYPGGSLKTIGKFFDVYHFDSSTLASPICYQTPPPVPVYPEENGKVEVQQPIDFRWESGNPEVDRYTVLVEQQLPNVFWIEAEDAFQGNGWYMASEFTTGFSGQGFLLDNWQSGEVEYSVSVQAAGEYRIWVRSYKRVHNDQVNSIAINKKSFVFAGPDVALDQWNWESIGTFELPAGETKIGLSRLYGNDDQYSVFIDSILITPDLENSPGPHSVWDPMVSTTRVDPLSSYLLQSGLPEGNYRWSVRVFDGSELINSLGEPGIPMPFATFSVVP